MAYPLLFVAVGKVVQRSGVRESAAWLDAGMWTGGAVVAACRCCRPSCTTPTTNGQRVTALAYPAMDLVLLLLVVHQG